MHLVITKLCEESQKTGMINSYRQNTHGGLFLVKIGSKYYLNV